MSDFGFPYMGSKGPLAKWVLQKIPKADHLYDLFGGGFAISHCAAMSEKWKNVHYNEIQKDVTDLVKDAIAGKYSSERFKPEWISRHEFFRRKSEDAYVRYIWSFGNEGGSYLFGEDLEPLKRSMHQAVVFGKFDKTFIDLFGFNSWGPLDSVYERRIYIRKVIAHKKKKSPDNYRSDQLERLQQLSQLERLERLERLENVNSSRLHITSMDYREVPIKKDSVIYCDPPYIGTASYSKTGFNHEEFYDWVRNNKRPVFISEYTMPDEFKVIASMSKIQKLSSNKENRKSYYETIFANNLGYDLYMDTKSGLIKPKTIRREREKQ